MGSLRVGHDWVASLSLFTFMHWKRKWQPLQYSCLENPRDRGAWWAAVYGVAQSWTRLKRLSSSSSSRTVRRKFLLFKSPSFLIATPADRDSPLIFIIPLFLSYAAWFNLGWHWAHLTDYFLTSTEDTCDHKVNKMYARVLIRTSGYTLLKVHRKKKRRYINIDIDREQAALALLYSSASFYCQPGHEAPNCSSHLGP